MCLPPTKRERRSHDRRISPRPAIPVLVQVGPVAATAGMGYDGTGGARMKQEHKSGIIYAVLWLAFILAMIASIQHLASTFGTAEQPSLQWLGWIPAVAVDAGLAALAYS